MNCQIYYNDKIFIASVSFSSAIRKVYTTPRILFFHVFLLLKVRSPFRKTKAGKITERKYLFIEPLII